MIEGEMIPGKATMIGRNSLGPVFVYDMRTLVRRWQVYAVRAAFVLFLLLAMLIAWVAALVEYGLGTGSPTIHQLAEIGEILFYFLAGVQVSFILLAAPAAAAGSICIDRARGTLLHMMVTDLSDAEIVLGRLGSRLMPVFSLVASGVPVVALAGLLGGIDFGALVGLFVVSIALAILGCSLALAISVKASKTHEVLMAVYLAFGVWLLSLPIWWIVVQGTKLPTPPDWFQKLNPFQLVYAPYMSPGFAGPIDFVIFFGLSLIFSVGLVAWSIRRLRRAVIESSSEKNRAKSRLAWLLKFWPTLPGPTLDGNPVLWREWHRNRPSKLARWLWRGMLFVTWAMAAWGTYKIITEGVSDAAFALELSFMLQLFFGFLMVAATSPTVLAEERTRGSLDVLLSTPLSTRSIVLAKWWGAYRMVLGLAILPMFVAIFLAAASPDLPANNGTIAGKWKPIPLTLTDRFAAVACCITDFLASGALIVSIGVLLATWISRIGRAVGASVVLFVLIGIGWIIVMIISELFLDLSEWGSEAISCLSPVFGPIKSISMLTEWTNEPRGWFWIYLALVILAKLAGAGILLWLTLLTFNRCLGRVVESRSAKFRPPLEPLAPRSSRRKPTRPTMIEEEKTLVTVDDSPSSRS
jgi:ABC-type transport system involved in multi-copper enzyme maturation permease subunit